MAGRPLRHMGVELLTGFYAMPEEWARLMSRVAKGDAWADVLDANSITWGAWLYWSKDNPEAAQDVADSRQGYADRAVFEARDLADTASPDDVAVAKLRGDRRWQLASRLDRVQWGEKEQAGPAHGTLVINIGDLRGNALPHDSTRVIDVSPEPDALGGPSTLTVAPALAVESPHPYQAVPRVAPAEAV